MLHLADEAPAGVAHQHARQQARLAQDLEAVADAEHQAAALGMGADRVHDTRARRDRAAAQVVAVGKAAGQHDEVGPLGQRALVVPDDRRARRRSPAASARATSPSRLEPGNRTTAARSGLVMGNRVVLDDRIGEQLLAGLAQGARRGLGDRRAAISMSNTLPWRTLATPSTPSDFSAPSIALPCGSRTPDFKVTTTRAFIEA